MAAGIAARRKLEDDALFKEIGGQLDSANFDYSEWQRSHRAPKKITSRRSRAAPPQQRDAKSAQDRPITVHSGSSAIGSSLKRAFSAGAPACHHHWRKQETHIDDGQDKTRIEAIKVLQLRIRARRQTLDEYKKRQVQLLKDNMQLREQITQEESDAHETVKKLLRKYERFQGGIAALNNRYGGDLVGARDTLEETKAKIKKQVAAQEADVAAIDQQLQVQQKELNMLANYKNKDYPVKALKISDLQKTIEQLQLHNQGEESELQHIVDTEIEKLRREQMRVREGITQKATEDVLSQMHPSLRDMAKQNAAMQKELEFHQKEIVDLEASIQTLDREVKELLRSPKTNVRQMMFPEFFPTQEKCTPDMDVILDIPTQEWLPI